MKMSRILIILIMGAALGAASRCAAQDANSKEVVAVINGQDITQSDLEQKEMVKLLKARDQFYLAQKDALNQLIEDSLLEAQAKKEGVTVDELLDKHVNSKVTDPTEDQLQVYYEGIQTTQPYSEVRPKIVDTIHQHRVAKLRAEYIKSLRDSSNIVVMLQPPAASVPLGKTATRGAQDAPVTIIEFADYECPYCQKMDPDLRKLQDDFKGQIRFAFKDFPLPMHKHAEKAAEASRCAEDQNKYWEYHDRLFSKDAGLDVPELKQYANDLGLDSAKFDACLDSGKEADAIQEDVEQGNHLGISGTPAVFINGHFFSGITSYTVLHDEVAQQISFHATSARKDSAK